MSLTYGTQCAIINAGNEPAVTQVGGRRRSFIETVTLAAQAIGSTIEVAQLPAGAQILGMTYNATVTLGGTATLAVGDGTTPAAYVAAAAYSAVTLQQLAVAIGGAGVQSPLAAPGVIVLTTAGAALPAAGTIVFTTEYVVD